MSAASGDEVSRTVTAADMPRIPHTDSDDALKTFRLANGFSLELVAAEPLTGDPVAACFDQFGRMFVAEMHGYPFSQEPTKLNPNGGGKKNAGIIRLLEDTNGDGRMNHSVVFAEGISWPTSICCYNGGVFVIAPQFLYYLKDTDGDSKADTREVVLSGFGRDNVQAVTNGLQWGLDNRIYFAAGRNPKTILHRGKPLTVRGGVDLRFDPKTETFESVTGGLQFGHSMDDWGTRFVCSNSNHIQQVVFPQGYLARNPYLIASGLIRSIAADGASAQVFRISPPEPWRIVRQKWRAADKGYKLIINDDGGWEFIPLDPTKKKGAVPTEYPEGYFTSATGITIYRGNAYPLEYRGNAFVGDVGGNLVHRKTLNTDSIVYRAERADAGQEFLACSDNWFRPVNFVNAPDGTLYVLDMYRETVEHPYSIPDEIKKFLYLTSGHDRGRIYRLVSPDMKRIRPPKIGTLSNQDLVRQLDSNNSWNRDTAQRLLWERQDPDTVPLVESFLAEAKTPQGRMHCLCTLDAINALTPQHVEEGLSDTHARVRTHAVRLSERFLRESPNLLKDLLPLCHDESEHVRFQLAFSLGESSAPAAVDALTVLAKDPQNDRDIRTALLSSMGRNADQLAAALLADPATTTQNHVRSIISELGLIMGANPDASQSLTLLTTVTSDSYSLATQQLALAALGEGLSRRGASVTSLLANDAVSSTLKHQVQHLFDRAARSASDNSQTEADRQHAIQLLAYADFATAALYLPDFLSSRTSQRLQLAAVNALALHQSDRVPEILLTGWQSYSPQIRRNVADALMSTTPRTRALLSAVEDGSVKRGDIGRDHKQVLLSHRDGTIKSRSSKLFGSEVVTNRSQVVADHQHVLRLQGRADNGQQIFKKICSACHKVGDVGHQVAPDLASVKNKSEADLLVAILDPNREAQPNFNTYTVVTAQGRSFNGIIAAETANSITLKRAEAKQDVVLRSNIEELIASGISLMPEGLEKDLKPQDLADVIAFVKSITTSKAE
ncbi:MAG: HEAT repeat domain-containing protein [Fuerstiella sp.]|nr:HEAT repeat domain-containing protein [Fuerstiella sp.]